MASGVVMKPSFFFFPSLVSHTQHSVDQFSFGKGVRCDIQTLKSKRAIAVYLKSELNFAPCHENHENGGSADDA